MKIKTLVCALCATTVLGSCSFDDGDLWNAVNSQEERLSALEKWQKSVETQLGALQGIISATDYVTGVEAVEKDGVKGYKISFLHAQPITLYYNEGGEISGSSSIGVAQEEGTNKYYWTMDGEPLMVDGKKVYVSGNDDVSLNAVSGGLYELTIGDMKITVDGEAVSVNPIKSVDEQDGKVIISLKDGSTKELLKYVDFGEVLSELYQNTGGDHTYPLALREGFMIEALNVPSGWTIAIESTESGKLLKVTYPNEGEVTVRFLITDGKGLSVLQEARFKVGEPIPVWVNVQYEGQGHPIVIPAGTEDIKITGSTAVATLRDDVCAKLRQSSQIKHIDLSGINHSGAIPANCFYNMVYNGPTLDEANSKNESIETIILPRDYNNVFNDAFKNCKKLKSVTFLALPKVDINGTTIFAGCDVLEAIYVPAEDVETFKTYSGLQPYAGKIQAIPEVPAQ